jgi:hypothetical protein
MPTEEPCISVGDTVARRGYFFAPGWDFALAGVVGAGCVVPGVAGWLASVPPAVAPGCLGLAGGCCAVPPAGGWAVLPPGCCPPTLVGGGDSGSPALPCDGARAVFLALGAPSLRQPTETSNTAAANNINMVLRFMRNLLNSVASEAIY